MAAVHCDRTEGEADQCGKPQNRNCPFSVFYGPEVAEEKNSDKLKEGQSVLAFYCFVGKLKSCFIASCEDPIADAYAIEKHLMLPHWVEVINEGVVFFNDWVLGIIHYQLSIIVILGLPLFNKYIMFTKLRNTETNLKTERTYTEKSIYKRRSQEASYSRIHRQKKHENAQNHDYRVVWSKSYLYEGQWLGAQKNGEGIMMLKNGTMVIGHWQKDLLSGRAVIFTPFGGIAHVNFVNGKLNGWNISQYSNKIIIVTLYFEDKIDGFRIIYEESSKIWVTSQFTRDGKFLKLLHVEKGSRGKLPTFVNSDELESLFDEVVVREDYVSFLKKIKNNCISNTINYVGYMENAFPSGLGVTFSKNFCFSGYYEKGELEIYGRMVFENGQIYQGNITRGEFHGEGIYYDPKQNKTRIINSFMDAKPQILEQHNGYLLIDFAPKIGEKIVNQQIGLMGSGINLVCEMIEKYYYQYFIEESMKQEINYSIKSNIDEQSLKDLQKNPNRAENEERVLRTQTAQRWLELEHQGNSQKESQLNSEKKHVSQKIAIGYQKSPPLSRSPSPPLSPPLSPTHRSPTHRSPAPLSPTKRQKLSRNKNELPSINILQSAKIDNKFMSIEVKQNKHPEERESYNIKQPNKNQWKKNIYLNLKNSSNFIETKSLDINQVTFRDKNDETNKNEKKQQMRMSRDEQKQKIPKSANTQYQKIKFAYPSQDRNLIQDEVSSEVSNISNKLNRMLKKPTISRKKIFQ